MRSLVSRVLVHAWRSHPWSTLLLTVVVFLAAQAAGLIKPAPRSDARHSLISDVKVDKPVNTAYGPVPKSVDDAVVKWMLTSNCSLGVDDTKPKRVDSEAVKWFRSRQKGIHTPSGKVLAETAVDRIVFQTEDGKHWATGYRRYPDGSYRFDSVSPVLVSKTGAADAKSEKAAGDVIDAFLFGSGGPSASKPVGPVPLGPDGERMR